MHAALAHHGCWVCFRVSDAQARRGSDGASASSVSSVSRTKRKATAEIDECATNPRRSASPFFFRSRRPPGDTSVMTARGTLSPRIGAAVSAAIPGKRSRLKDRCPRPARPSLADLADPPFANRLPLQQLREFGSSSSRPALLRMTTTLSAARPPARRAATTAGALRTSPRTIRSARNQPRCTAHCARSLPRAR